MKKIKSIDTFMESWKLLDDEERPVANFTVKVLSIEEIKYPQHTDTLVCVKIIFTDRFTSKVKIPYNELDTVDWSSFDKRCVINKQRRTARAYFNDYVRRQFCNCTVRQKIGIDRQGITKVNNTAVFLAGDKLITPSDNNEPENQIEIQPTDFRFDIDPQLSPKAAYSGMRELMELSPEIGPVLVAHTISGMVRSAFKDIGFIPCAVLVIVGETGMYKTHYVSHMVQLYNRNDEIKPVTRLNSTSRFIEDILYEYAECTAVIDDLHTGSSSQIKRNNENTAEELIRRISDDTGRGYKNGNALVQKSFRGNAIFIGEYFNGKGSTVPRALIANITRRIDGEILDEYQRHKKLVVSTFYYYFLQWYVDNYSMICGFIDKKLTTHRKTKYETKLHSRLLDTYFYLTVSYELFLSFCEASGFISDTESEREDRSFTTHVCRLILNQQNRFVPQTTDYLALISRAYKKGKFQIARNVSEFNENIHDGVIHYDCLCIFSKRFDTVLRNTIPDFDHREVIRYLKDNNALKLHESDGKNDVKISTLNKRFFAIYLNKLN